MTMSRFVVITGMRRLLSTAYRGGDRNIPDRLQKFIFAGKAPPRAPAGSVNPVFSSGSPLQERVILQRQESIGSRNMGPLAGIHLAGAVLFAAVVTRPDQPVDVLVKQASDDDSHEPRAEVVPLRSIDGPSRLMRGLAALTAIAMALGVLAGAYRFTRKRLIEIRVTGGDLVRLYRRSMFGSPGLALIREVAPHQVAVDFTKLRSGILARYSRPRSKRFWEFGKSQSSSSDSVTEGDRIENTVVIFEIRAAGVPSESFTIDARDLSKINMHALESFATDISPETVSGKGIEKRKKDIPSVML